jgi:hypothetical protein
VQLLSPGGVKGRGAVACASVTTIRANEVSENMSLSVRERAEGFLAVCSRSLLTPYSAEGSLAGRVLQ